MEQERLNHLYAENFGSDTLLSYEKLPLSGSNRQYFRFKRKDGKNIIGVIGTSQEENHAFIEMAQALKRFNIPVPTVYAWSEDESCYFQEDLGDLTLFDALQANRDKDGRYGRIAHGLLGRIMTMLPSIQYQGHKANFYDVCYPIREMNSRSIHFDLNYFKYNFLKLSGIEYDEIRLENDFDSLSYDLLCVSSKEVAFQYRDFQARNVMLKNGAPYFIDFQGGRRGPIYYDVASFLWQASAQYTPEMRDKLIDDYIVALHPFCTISKWEFIQKLRIYVLFRTLQVLGAYGFRGLWELKPHFIKSIPNAIKNLEDLAKKGIIDNYPTLKKIAFTLAKDYNVSHIEAPIQKLIKQDSKYLKDGKESTQLIVDVWSFSYKKGIPEDTSGNGGGYVFDCRATHNPGRYEAYKELPGLERPVVEFLEHDGEITTFLESVYKLADFHTQRFIDRGFTHLQFAFGCTGGMHRSVYSAQHLAEHLNAKFNIEVRIHHREIKREFILPVREPGVS